MLKKILLIVTMVLLTSRSTVAEDIQTNHPPQSTGEQILTLPQDENKLYMTLYGDPDDERYQRVRKWFDENAGLRAIRAQTHYAAIDTNSKLFQGRYADEVTSVPCLRFVTPGGVEVLKLDASQLPISDKALNNGVRTELMRNLFGGRNQKQKQQDKKSGPDILKQKIDDKIDGAIDNANLPPVTSYVLSRIAKWLIGVIFVVVIVVALGLALLKVLREVREAQQV